MATSIRIRLRATASGDDPVPIAILV